MIQKYIDATDTRHEISYLGKILFRTDLLFKRVTSLRWFILMFQARILYDWVTTGVPSVIIVIHDMILRRWIDLLYLVSECYFKNWQG